jgi:hypothetical protein
VAEEPVAEESTAPTSFDAVWAEMAPEARQGAVAQLEQQVGDIDRAYDGLMAQLGERPQEQLSREDKGAVLMEFGLHLMSQAGRGGSTLGSVGDAGLAAMRSYQLLKARNRERGVSYDRDIAAIEGARQEAMAGARDEHRATRELELKESEGALAGRQVDLEEERSRSEMTGRALEGALNVQRTAADVRRSDAEIAQMEREANAPSRQSTPRELEFNAMTEAYMRAHAVDANGQPLAEGSPERLRVERDALAFAAGDQGMSAGEIMQKAREMAMKEYEQGYLMDRVTADTPAAKVIDARTRELASELGHSAQQQPTGALSPAGQPAPRSPARGVIDRSGSEQTDVTTAIPQDVIQSMPEGEPQANEDGQIFIRRGDRVYYVGSRQ